MSEWFNETMDMVCPNCAESGTNPNCPLCKGTGRIRMSAKALIEELVRQVNALSKMAHTHKASNRRK